MLTICYFIISVPYLSQGKTILKIINKHLTVGNKSEKKINEMDLFAD